MRFWSLYLWQTRNFGASVSNCAIEAPKLSIKHIYVVVNHIQLTYSYYKGIYSNIFSGKLSICVINNHFVCDLTKPAWR
jgi:hypothetical protein